MAHRLLVPVAGLLLVTLVAACTASPETPAPETVSSTAVSAPSAPASSAGLTTQSGQSDPVQSSTTTSSPGTAGTVTLKIDGQDPVELATTCAEFDGQLTAEGRTGTASINVLVSGSNPTAVYTISTKGATLIFQARQGLKDAAGDAAGELKLTEKDGTYTGTGVFVYTKVDEAGTDVTPKKSNTRPGTFTLVCAGDAPG
ncbi:hypothetical protein D1871_14185 [Nakamurella silvestris]|nr:hypothetical protein D1871_14185 [Nakamurella silvestris]